MPVFSIRLPVVILLSCLFVACGGENKLPTGKAVDYTVISKEDAGISSRSRMVVRIVAASARTEDARAQTALKAAEEIYNLYHPGAVSVVLELDPALAGNGYTLATADYAPDGLGWTGTSPLINGTWEATVTGYTVPAETLRIAKLWYANRSNFQLPEGAGGPGTDEPALKAYIAKIENIDVSKVDLTPLMGLEVRRHNYVY